MKDVTRLASASPLINGTLLRRASTVSSSLESGVLWLRESDLSHGKFHKTLLAGTLGILLSLSPLVFGQSDVGQAEAIAVSAMTEFDEEEDEGRTEDDVETTLESDRPANTGEDPAAEPNKLRVAVYEFKVRGNLGLPDAGSIIAEWMISSLAATNRFTLMERVLLQQVIEEQELQSSYLADESALAAEAGRLHGVEAVVSGTVLQWDETISIVARLVDTSTGVIRKTAEVKTRRRQNIPDEIDLLARKLAGPVPIPATPKMVAIPAQVEVATPDRIELDSERIRISILPTARFHLGDEMQFRVTSQQSGYLTVLDINAQGQVSQVYPLGTAQPGTSNGRISPGQPVTIPEPYSGLRFTAGEPTGTGRLLAILSSHPITAAALAEAESHAAQGSLDFADVESVITRLQRSLEPTPSQPLWSMSLAEYVIDP
jgi:TolB-like protein